jgi:DNA helicase-2/ATP-dependent DNA helicase PcrA
LFDERLNTVLDELERASESGLSAVAAIAAGAWDQLSVTAGQVPWRRASYGFLAAARGVEARGLPTRDGLAQLATAVDVLRTGALVSEAGPRGGRTTLMNFHQTKGREADFVVLVYRDGDYLADRTDTEPFTDPSRVLYVALTRARRSVTVVLPSEPHPLVAPFGSLE